MQHERAIILYIGSAANLFNRFKGHNLYYKLLKRTDLHAHIDFFFKEVDNYLEVEKYLIQEIKPRYNVRHNSKIKKVHSDFNTSYKKAFKDKNSQLKASVDDSGKMLVTINPTFDVSKLDVNYSRSVTLDIDDAIKFRDELTAFIRKSKSKNKHTKQSHILI